MEPSPPKVEVSYDEDTNIAILRFRGFLEVPDVEEGIKRSFELTERSVTGKLKSVSDITEMKGSSLAAKFRAIGHLRSKEIVKTERGALIVSNIFTWLLIEVVVTLTGTANRFRIFFANRKNHEGVHAKVLAWLKEPESRRPFYEE